MAEVFPYTGFLTLGQYSGRNKIQGIGIPLPEALEGKGTVLSRASRIGPLTLLSRGGAVVLPRKDRPHNPKVVGSKLGKMGSAWTAYTFQALSCFLYNLDCDVLAIGQTHHHRAPWGHLLATLVPDADLQLNQVLAILHHSEILAGPGKHPLGNVGSLSH